MPVATPAGEVGPPATAMPCHGAAKGHPAGGLADHAVADGQDRPPGCPHCSGDGPATASQCACQAAPAGLAPSGHAPMMSIPGQTQPLPVMVSDALPEWPGERLFRPPIAPR